MRYIQARLLIIFTVRGDHHLKPLDRFLSGKWKTDCKVTWLGGEFVPFIQFEWRIPDAVAHAFWTKRTWRARTEMINCQHTGTGGEASRTDRENINRGLHYRRSFSCGSFGNCTISWTATLCCHELAVIVNNPTVIARNYKMVSEHCHGIDLLGQAGPQKASDTCSQRKWHCGLTR